MIKNKEIEYVFFVKNLKGEEKYFKRFVGINRNFEITFEEYNFQLNLIESLIKIDSILDLKKIKKICKK